MQQTILPSAGLSNSDMAINNAELLALVLLAMVGCGPLCAIIAHFVSSRRNTAKSQQLHLQRMQYNLNRNNVRIPV